MMRLVPLKEETEKSLILFLFFFAIVRKMRRGPHQNHTMLAP